MFSDTERELLRRFVRKIDVFSDNDCLIWTGAHNYNGYGWFAVNSRQVRAHRFIYSLTNGPIPEGMDIDHLCRNRDCVNPYHMEVVTRKENLMRGNTHARFNKDKSHCCRGHLLSGSNVRINRRGGRVCRECERQGCRSRRRVRAYQAPAAGSIQSVQ
jgi:hypothetical protein